MTTAPTTRGSRFGAEFELTAASLGLDGEPNLMRRIDAMKEPAKSNEVARIVRIRLAACNIDVTGCIALKPRAGKP